MHYDIGTNMLQIRSTFHGRDIGPVHTKARHPAMDGRHGDFPAAEAALCRCQIHAALLPILQRCAMRQKQLMLARFIGHSQFKLRAGGVQCGQRTDQVVLCLRQLRRLHGKQWSAGRHHVAGAGHDARYPAGVGREDGRAEIVVQADPPFSVHLGC